MNKIKSIDLIAFTYLLYFSFTLAIDKSIFDAGYEVYSYMAKINKSEMAWGITAFIIAVIYFAHFLFKNQKWLSVLASTLGGIFFIVIGSAYLLTYPNLGSGIFTIVGIVCFMNISQIILPKEEVRKEVEEIEKSNGIEQ